MYIPKWKATRQGKQIGPFDLHLTETKVIRLDTNLRAAESVEDFMPQKYALNTSIAFTSNEAFLYAQNNSTRAQAVAASMSSAVATEVAEYSGVLTGTLAGLSLVTGRGVLPLPDLGELPGLPGGGGDGVAPEDGFLPIGGGLLPGISDPVDIGFPPLPPVVRARRPLDYPVYRGVYSRDPAIYGFRDSLMHYECTDHLGNVRAVIYEDNIADDKPAILSLTDYYPFGAALPGRQFSANAYRYGFNGLEEDREWGNVEHEFRGYDPLIGRFRSLDPLKDDYPDMTPFQFASNTPLQAVDIEGKEAFFIHGTWGRPSQFSSTLQSGVATVFGNSAYYAETWSAGNTNVERQVSAVDMARIVMAKNIQGEPITLFGHSHGGNVAIETANILVKNHGINPKDINIVTLNTPVRADYQLESSDFNHFNIYSPDDKIQISGGWDTDLPIMDKSARRRYESSWVDFLIDPLGNDFQEADAEIEYEDQFPFKWKADCGASGHCGQEPRNVKVWMPKLKAAVKNHQSNQSTITTQSNTASGNSVSTGNTGGSGLSTGSSSGNKVKQGP